MILLLTALSDPTNLHLCREKRSVQNDKMHALPMHVLSLEMHSLPLCLLCRKSMAVSFYHACFYNKEQLQNLKKMESVWTCKQKPDFLLGCLYLDNSVGPFAFFPLESLRLREF